MANHPSRAGAPDIAGRFDLRGVGIVAAAQKVKLRLILAAFTAA
jgi:hypothetical protein